MKSLKPLIRDLLPPVLWRGGSRIKRALRNRYGVEQPPEFYDESFKRADHWKQHYTESHYYPIWTVIADRLRRAGVQRVLDVGCGPGQVASLLRDEGIPHYQGVDFSQERILHARAVCPDYEFVQADIYRSELLETAEYDCFLTLEFLEHVDRDLEVLERVRPGVTVLATVPNFPGEGHVRHFVTADSVEARYGPLFTQLEVTEILANPEGKKYFIIQGVK